MTRKSAFDPSRLDEEIDELLPPPAAPIITPQSSRQQPAKPLRAVPAATPRPAPSSPAQSPRAVPARIPVTTYGDLTNQLATRTERPAYAQIVAWACRTHPQDVLDNLIAANAAAAHALRGRRSANSTVSITPRFRPDELAALDDVVEQAAAQLGTRPTRTAAILASLQTALQAGIPTTV